MKLLLHTFMAVALVTMVVPAVAEAQSATAPFGTYEDTGHPLCPPLSGYIWSPPKAYGAWDNSVNYNNYSGADYGCRTQSADGIGSTSVCTGSERFFDDFERGSLSDSKWETGYYWTEDGASEGRAAGGHQSYANSLTDPVFDVNNSILTITPRRQGSTHMSGALTAQIGDVDYAAPRGCFEIRAKMPNGAGAFPAFWMISSSGPDWTTPGYENERDWRPEIDVVETIGQSNTFYTTAHQLGSASAHEPVFPVNTDTSGNWKSANVASAFHTFSARWSASGIVWYLDGVEIQRTSTTAQTPNMFVHLNYALGYNWGATPVDSSFFDGGPPTYQIDYVKVTS